MRVSDGSGVQSGFLDYARGPVSVRIRVTALINLAEIQDQLFVKKRRIAMILAYLREVGIRSVVRSVVARRSERLRNTRFLSDGIGEKIESDVTSGLPVGTGVVFAAALHPAWVERMVRALKVKMAG
ncbi:MAG: hypothetical protein WD771_06720 [Gemmatimonadaceae bacterium]